MCPQNSEVVHIADINKANQILNNPRSTQEEKDYATRILVSGIVSSADSRESYRSRYTEISGFEFSEIFFREFDKIIRNRR